MGRRKEENRPEPQFQPGEQGMGANWGGGGLLVLFRGEVRIISTSKAGALRPSQKQLVAVVLSQRLLATYRGYSSDGAQSPALTLRAPILKHRAHRWDSRGSLDLRGKGLLSVSAVGASSSEPFPATC